MKRKLKIIICLLVSLPLMAQTVLIEKDDEGRLKYNADSDGFVIPDFSYAGYRNSNRDIPTVDVVETLTPIDGDNTARIQSAIDRIGQLDKNENGIRGALLLKSGRYEVQGTLQVKYDGVVIRGEGSDTGNATSTVIYATGNTPAQRDVIVLGKSGTNRWTTKVSGTQKNITDDIVPVGSRSFSVEDASPYRVGDMIAIYHPCSAKWLEAIDYGGVPDANEQWTEGKYPILYHRYITAIEGDEITVDAPVYYTLNKSLSQSYIYKINETFLSEIGIEDICIEIESKGGEDENHAWQGIHFRSVENCWAKNVSVKGFGQSGFITESCTRTTIENCKAIDPVSINDGERRYNFNTYVNSQLILFKDCYANEGRHHYVSNGTSTVSGIVFLHCVSDAIYNTNEGHRHWSQGMLFDNHKEQNLVNREFVLGLYNRVDMGTGHGWSAVQSVLWNCDVTSKGVIGLQKPPTSQNYAIGCTAKSITGRPVSNSNYAIGYVEARNNPVTEIPSLFLAQLADRKGNTEPPEEDEYTSALIVHEQFNKAPWEDKETTGNYTFTIPVGDETGDVRLINCKTDITKNISGASSAGRIIMDGKDAVVQLPELPSCGYIKINVNSGSDDKVLTLEQQVGDAWIVVTTFPTSKTVANVTHYLKSEEPLTLRLVNGTGSMYLYEIWITDYVKKNNTHVQPEFVAVQQEIREVQYYSIDGKRVLNPQKGFYIKRLVFENGQVETTKVFVGANDYPPDA